MNPVNPVNLVLEEASWQWRARDLSRFIEQIERLLDEVDVAFDRGEEVIASRELLEQPVAGEPLSQQIWTLPREVTERLAALFVRIRYWDDDTPFDAEGFEAEIAGERVVSPSAVFAQRRVCEGEICACVPLPGRWSGPVEVVVDGVAEDVHFLCNEATHRGFFRAVLAAQNHDTSAVAALAPHAFPSLCFVPNVWRGLRDFAGGYARARHSLLGFLAALDDHGAWIFTDTTGRLSPNEAPTEGAVVGVSDSLIQERFRGFGLVVAPEKANVQQDKQCRQERTRTLGGEELYCEWHYKLEGHVNRVHIHPPTAASDERVIVAIFAKHLRLPGD